MEGFVEVKGVGKKLSLVIIDIAQSEINRENKEEYFCLQCLQRTNPTSRETLWAEVIGTSVNPVMKK